MKLITNSTSMTKSLPRCQHRTPSGRRCRFPVQDAFTAFCQAHFGHHLENSDFADLERELFGELEAIQSAADINFVLANLFRLLAKNRIPTKRAAVLTYILQQLTRTLPEIARENKDAVQDIIIDTPRPNLDDPAPQAQPS
jgi:hypothetical protein